jgi:hypothetical protein
MEKDYITMYAYWRRCAKRITLDKLAKIDKMTSAKVFENAIIDIIKSYEDQKLYDVEHGGDIPKFLTDYTPLEGTPGVDDAGAI